MKKKLYCSTKDKKILGVCGGIAEYFDMDPTIVRIIAAASIILFAGLPGLIIYFVLGFIIPKDTEKPYDDSFKKNNDSNDYDDIKEVEKIDRE